MAQTLKDDIRQGIVDAAEEEFAAAGYRDATMAAIAKAAGVSTGNLYRYFANKDALFYAILTDEFAAEFLRLTRRRVSLLLDEQNLSALGPSSQEGGDALLSFWIAHRLQVVILLSGADGSRFEDFASRFTAALLQPTVEQLKRACPQSRLSPISRRALQTIFDNTVNAIVGALYQNRTEAAIREAIAAFWSYQLAGLEGFRTWVLHEQRT